MRDHHSVQVNDIRKLLLQNQELNKSEPNVLLSAPNLQEGCGQSDNDDPGTANPQGVIRLDIKMPGSEVLKLEVNSSATIQDIKLHVAGKLPPVLRTFKLHFDGLALSSNMSCGPLHESRLQVALFCKAEAAKTSAPVRRRGGREGSKDPHAVLHGTECPTCYHGCPTRKPPKSWAHAKDLKKIPISRR